MVIASTGVRPAELKRAEPQDVDLERRVWLVRTAKGGAPRVFWLNDGSKQGGKFGAPRRRFVRKGGALPVLITRLHVRYDRKHFPEDLFFQETKDTANYQGRYVLRHPWKGEQKQCAQAEQYYSSVRNRQETEAQTLANLTGWDINEIRRKIGFEKPYIRKSWWKNLWD